MQFLILLTVLFAILRQSSLATEEDVITVTDKGPCLEGSNHTLTCKLKKSRSIVRWIDGNDVIPIVQCEININCTLNPDYKNQYNYSYNPIKNEVDLIILKVDKSYNGKMLVCSDGTNSGCKILNVSEYEHSMEKTENGTVTATSACSSNRNVSFKWIKIDASSYQEVEFKPKIIYTYVTHCSNKCGNSTKYTEVISIATSGDETKYNVKMTVIYGTERAVSERQDEEFKDKRENRTIVIVVIVAVIVAAVTVAIIVLRKLKQGNKLNKGHHRSRGAKHTYHSESENLEDENELLNSEIHKNRNMRSTRKGSADVPLEMTKRQQENKRSQNQQELDNELEEQVPEASECYNRLISSQEIIEVTELYNYVSGRTDESFRGDFQKIPSVFKMSCSFATRPENIYLNRYLDILPYDNTRVCIDDEPDFFINASYIGGHREPKEYIACCGPTASKHDNFKTFWKMVWHEQSEIIVMVTSLKDKCKPYWPDENQDEVYGDILVSSQKIEMFAEYTIRSFEVTKTTNTETSSRRLVHLHYTAWPSKKTPEDVTSILEFRQKFEHKRKTSNSPVIVHCSGGIGRTGVFIAIDRLIMQRNDKKWVNVVNCITEMRQQRMKMVQTWEQYKFIFQALAYAFCFDCGPIPIRSLGTLNEKYFDMKYQELQLSLECKSKEQILSRAKNEIHKDKNRQGADIPENTNRMYPSKSYGDSDNIYAVFINSFKRKDYFIMAQSPFPGTESDFLTMIYQEECVCVVSMEDFNDHGMKIGKYLIEENMSLDIGSFTVSCFIDDTKPQYTAWKVTIKNKDQVSKYERYFYFFQCNNWTAENDSPPNVEEFVELVKDVQEYAKLGEEKSHVLVHCVKDNKCSGVFCAIAIIREKLLIDGEVSVMNILRHLRTRVSSAITSKEQLKLCYKAVGVIAQRELWTLYQ